MNNRISGMTGLAGLLMAFVLLSVLVSQWFPGARIDLTETKLYTLSDGTRAVLSKLEQPIELTLYFSDKATANLAGLRTYASRVRELLEEYEVAAGGNITLSVVDPVPFSEAEDRASASGLQGVPAGFRGDEIYFGLVGRNAEGDEEIISFFQPDKESFLEYDLSKLVSSLNTAEAPVIGILSSLPMTGGFDFMTRQNRPSWIVLDQIEDLFEVVWVDADTDVIDPEVDVLMLVHPKQVADQTLLAIDQFAMRGGKVLAFVDPLAESEQAGAAAGPSEIDPLLQSWGVALRENALLGDYANSLVVSMAGSPTPVRHVGLLGMGPERFTTDDVVVADLESVNFSSVGILDRLEDSAADITPLVTSSAEAMPIDAETYKSIVSPVTLLEDFAPTGESYLLGARVSGKAFTAFPEGVSVTVETPDTDNAAEGADPAEEHDTAEAAEPETRLLMPQLTETDKLNVIVFADTDVLTDRLWVQVQDFFGQRIASAWADNSGLVINSLENLSGNEDLISIRSRGRYTRPFTLVEELRREADERFREQQQILEERLADTEARLAELEQTRGDDDKAILSDEQEAALLQFQQEKLSIRKELREVQHQLDRDIEQLGTRIKLLNILGIPLLLVLIVIASRFVRRQA